jgi:hypothetical protein
VRGLSVARPATGGNRETRAGAIEAGRSSVCVCDCAPLLAFRLGLGGEAYEFIKAVGEGGRGEAIGSDNAPVRAASPVALARLAVADDEDSGLEQRTARD